MLSDIDILRVIKFSNFIQSLIIFFNISLRENEKRTFNYFEIKQRCEETCYKAQQEESFVIRQENQQSIYKNSSNRCG